LGGGESKLIAVFMKGRTLSMRLILSWKTNHSKALFFSHKCEQKVVIVRGAAVEVGGGGPKIACCYYL